MSVSGTFAADLNQTADNGVVGVQDFEIDLAVEEINVGSDLSSDIGISAIGEDQLGMINTDDVAGNTADLLNGVDSQSVPDTYNDLRDDLENLNDGAIYDIKKDYTIEYCDYDLSKNRIININADNVVINGNGHTIDANRGNAFFAIFNITGRNVRIVDLNIIGSRARNIDYILSNLNIYGDDYNHLTSPIEWHGDNGHISNCVFYDNTGESGGAIYWKGNNGLIENCTFDDNAAEFGGSLYITGFNTRISDCLFKNSYTTFHYEAIYFANPKGIANLMYLNNCSFASDFMGAMDVDFENGCKVIFESKNENNFVPCYFTELIYYLGNLKDGEVFDIVHDFYLHTFDGSVVINASNVIINGNGHKIFGQDPAHPVFIINGNNVVITNLTFDFTAENDICPSIIEWKGDYGILSECCIAGNHGKVGAAVTWSGNNGILKKCTFINNTADVGGAIYWSGNKGIIDDNLFVDDVSRFGGSIYMGGIDNKISNSLFVNSTSSVTGEAIFADRNRKNVYLENIFFDEKTLRPFIDGAMLSLSLFDIGDFEYTVYIADEVVDIVPLIYNSLVEGGVIYYNDNVYYTSNYYNQSGDFVFTMVKEFKEYDIIYTKNFQFKKIYNCTYDDVYARLRDSDFLNTFSVSKTLYVSDKDSYLDAHNKFSSLAVMDPISNILSFDRQHSYLAKNSLTYALNVVFTTSLMIYSAATWSFESSPFEMLNIKGCYSSIRGAFKDKNEEKWVILKEGSTFGASYITLEGFNTVIENMGGTCMLVKVDFNNNRMDYKVDRDWGAAILNAGTVTCVNCTFTNNYAKNGGAIFNQGMLILLNTTFALNKAYGDGDDVCVGEGGRVIINEKEITSDTGPVYFADGLNMLESTFIGVAAAIISFAVGAVVGFFTANPAIGVGVGILVGAALGTGAAAIIITNTYDINQDRLAVLLTLMIGCAFSGAMGGVFGGLIGAEFFVEYLPFHMCAADFAWGQYGAVVAGGLVISSGIVGLLYNCVLM